MSEFARDERALAPANGSEEEDIVEADSDENVKRNLGMLSDKILPRMPKKKGRPHPPPPAPAIQEEEENLINSLLAQLDSRGNDSEPARSQQALSQTTALPKQNAKSRFLARQARKAASLAQASGQEDPAVQARLKQELEQEEGAIQRTCEELSLEVFNARRFACTPWLPPDFYSLDKP